MAEIKSTLDLVMERTRNLTLSTEEKREQALADLKQNYSGLLLRYTEGGLSREHFRKEFQELREKTGFSDARIFVGEMLERLDLDRDNSPLLTLLAEIHGCDTAGISQVLEAYRSTLAASAQSRHSNIRADIRQRHGISGSAVVPNMDADPKWAAERADLHRQFAARLGREKEQLMEAASA